MDGLDTIPAAGFWISVAGVVYAYLGYPVTIRVLSLMFGRSSEAPSIPDSQLPRITLLIAAHNEADVIEQRLTNALTSDYPVDRLQVVIASDGSDDGTVEICRRFEPRVRVLPFAERRGKAATLNAAMDKLDTELVVLSDANTMMEPTALRRLAAWFADPAVGSVCGRLVLTDALTGTNADGFYWRYETFLKRCEGRLGGLLGANGAIYAIRRTLFVPLPPGTMIDDFIVPLSARMHHGCHIVYDASAVAHEDTAPDLQGEFRRRSRIGVGGFQALGTLWPLLHPRYGWTAFTFWSHKVLRWVCPVLMIMAFATSAALIEHPLYRAAWLAQVVFYGLCGLSALIPPTNRLSRLLRLLPMFVGMNAALLIGLWRGLRRQGTGVWARTTRQPTEASTTRKNAA